MIVQLHTPTGVISVNSETVTDEELEALGLTFDGLFPCPCSTHVAQVVGFSPGAVRPLTIRRDCHGRWRQFDAFVSEDLKDQYLAGTLQVGDWVHVDFIEGNLDRALALTKVYKTW